MNDPDAGANVALSVFCLANKTSSCSRRRHSLRLIKEAVYNLARVALASGSQMLSHSCNVALTTLYGQSQGFLFTSKGLLEYCAHGCE